MSKKQEVLTELVLRITYLENNIADQQRELDELRRTRGDLEADVIDPEDVDLSTE